MLSLTVLRAYVRVMNRFIVLRDEAGQATTEYALVIVAAAVIGGLLIAWAGKTGFVDTLFDTTLGRVIKEV